MPDRIPPDFGVPQLHARLPVVPHHRSHGIGNRLVLFRVEAAAHLSPARMVRMHRYGIPEYAQAVLGGDRVAFLQPFHSAQLTHTGLWMHFRYQDAVVPVCGQARVMMNDRLGHCRQPHVQPDHAVRAGIRLVRVELIGPLPPDISIVRLVPDQPGVNRAANRVGVVNQRLHVLGPVVGAARNRGKQVARRAALARVAVVMRAVPHDSCARPLRAADQAANHLAAGRVHHVPECRVQEGIEVPRTL